MNKLKVYWGNLRASFWFLPTLIVLASGILAVGLIEADFTGSKQWAERWPRLFGAGADGARGMLSTIAGSMMTVVGITFSMILVTLALASSQYTSRILRTFMRDSVTQVVLGIFTGIFTYCLIVLRTIRGGDEGQFVPSMAVAVAVLLALAGVGVLIFFIHHIAASIQASIIIAAVAKETMGAVDRLFPEKLGDQPKVDRAEEALLALANRSWQAVPVKCMGYVQSVDEAAFLRVARENQTIVRMERGIGEFLVEDTILVSIALETVPKAEVVTALQEAYVINRYRTVEQDAGFGIRQLVDIALRALSPGINDTTTALNCVDYLTAILARLASRDIPSPRRYEDGKLRVMAIGPTFVGLMEEAFDQIRGSGSGNIALLMQMLGALETIASRTARPDRIQVLREQAEAIVEVAERTLASPRDRAQFDRRWRECTALRSEPLD